MVALRSFILCLLLISIAIQGAQSASDFSWSDCGIQLTKDIHYESATISTGAVGTGPLSINIKATIVNTIYGADTWLVIYKDGEQFMNVQIQNLCDIISTTTTLSCPIPVGPLSFTYTFSKIPPLPKGYYVFQIKSFSNYIGASINYVEQGCISLAGTAGNLGLKTNTFTSSFSVTISGAQNFQATDYSQRTIGQSYTIGTDQKLGQFTSTMKTSDDFGVASVDMTGYQWQLAGTLSSISSSGNLVSHVYTGLFEVYAPGDNVIAYLQGSFNLTNVIDSTVGVQGQKMSGTLTLDPKYIYDSSRFTYPLIIGNLGPFQMTMLSDQSTFVVSGNHTYCTGGVDGCGVCGGDGSSCGLGASAAEKGNAAAGSTDTAWTDKQKAAVAIGVGGGVLGLIAITFLAIMITRARRTPYYDDTDLIDHPQKPDYGTMAIDDIMREGERAPY